MPNTEDSSVVSLKSKSGNGNERLLKGLANLPQISETPSQLDLKFLPKSEDITPRNIKITTLSR